MKSNAQDTLRRFFAGVTEYAFHARMGVADPPLIDYLSELLTRFVRCDAVYRIRDLTGRRLTEVARMLAEADHRVGVPKREVHRHVGDFTLFWAGLYPEALRQMQRPGKRDQFLDYCAEGKRAYYIASTMPGDESGAESDLLRRLSCEFETCVYGLSEVRREWERREDAGDGPMLLN